MNGHEHRVDIKIRNTYFRVQLETFILQVKQMDNNQLSRNEQQQQRSSDNTKKGELPYGSQLFLSVPIYLTSAIYL
jgi:hypothetical protein